MASRSESESTPRHVDPKVSGAAWFSPWFLVGNGGRDPYDSPLRSPMVVPIVHSPIPYKP